MNNESIRNMIMLELVAPEYKENRLISEEESNALYLRYNEPRACTDAKRNWNYVFGPIKNEDFRHKMIDLFDYIDNND